MEVEEPLESVGSSGISTTAPPATRSASETAANGSTLDRRLFLYLGAVALVFAFLMGLKTLIDPDFFWQLATGRWVAQHHQIFSTDVFSYTAAGHSWIYPVGSALLFYGAYLLGGYALLCWLGAAACCGTVALLLRRGSAVTAAIAIVAVPSIASRTNPRAEMFTVVLFAAYLSILWENYRTGQARLWLLPVLMLAWVNLHLGFVSGLGLIVAFVGTDVLQMLRPSLRREAAQRLRRAAPWFAATAVATLVNPWGWGIYAALLRQNRVMAEHSEWFAEWGKLPLSWAGLARAFSLHNPSQLYILLIIVAIAAAVALLQREVGAALLLLGAAYEAVQHLRMQGLMACVAVVVGGSILYPAVQQIGARIRATRARVVLAAAASAMFVLLAAIWSTNVLKVSDMSLSSFGAGLCWWFPERAAAFIEREKIPGEIFNAYSQGGYLLWRLGPQRRDYIDGRAIPFGPGAFLHQAQLLDSPPDSGAWQAEAERYNINIILLPLNRFQSELTYLRNFCNSVNWKPVYLDEISGVFVRRVPETEELIRRSGMDCSTAPLPAEAPAASSADRFNQWANAAVVLAALGRNLEALTAARKASEVVPDASLVPWLRGNVAYAMGLRADAEREYLKAISRNPDISLFWFALATVYKHQGRIPETIQAQRKAIELSTMPKPYELLKLARLYLDTQQPRAALQAFDEAARSASPDILAAGGEHNFQFEVDQGRAEAWRALGDMKQAAVFDQKAVQDLVPRN